MRLRILLCVMAVAALAARSGAADIVQNAKAPAEILARAQAYLVSQVGPEYAAQNYELRDDLTTSTANTSQAPARSWTLAYRYRPWTEVGAAQSNIYVIVPADPERPASGYVATFDGAGKIIAPRVSRAEAETKMRAGGGGAVLEGPLSLDVQGDGRTAHPVWLGVFPVGETKGSCWITRRVTIDAVTGSVTVSPDETACE
ncbi:MAG TPA: hypothetical protein VGK20_13450 [Candidatus Binatia bacterium]